MQRRLTGFVTCTRRGPAQKEQVDNFRHLYSAMQRCLSEASDCVKISAISEKELRDLRVGGEMERCTAVFLPGVDFGTCF